MRNVHKYLAAAALLTVIVLAITAVSAVAQTGDADDFDYYGEKASGDGNEESADRSFGNTMITVGIFFIFVSFVASRLVRFQLRKKR